MDMPDPPPHDHQLTGDRVSKRYGRKPVPGHHRVTFGLLAFAKGWAVTFAVWALITLGIGILGSLGAGNGAAVDYWGLLLMASLIVAVFIGTPVALIFGLLLRSVRRQWVHVAAFFLGFGILTFAVMQLTLPWTSLRMPLLYALTVGFCAAVGRASVIGDVVVHPLPELHLPGPPPETRQTGKIGHTGQLGRSGHFGKPGPTPDGPLPH